MIKCNYCGSTAQVKFVKEEEQKDYIVKYYGSCGRTCSFADLEIVQWIEDK